MALLVSRMLIFLCMFSCFLGCALSKAQAVSAKCTHILTFDRLKDEPRDNHTLLVLVPWRVGFEDFVKFRPDTCWLDGFSIQVFLQALGHMQHPPPPHYKFVLLGTGAQTPHYDDMVDMLANQTVDAVVGDLTITKERMEKVGFTVPYLASSLIMLTPFRFGSAGTFWDFLKPFSRELWITLGGFFVATGLTLYLLEDQNPDFAITSTKREEVRTHEGSSTQSRVSTSTTAPAPAPAPDHGPAPPPSSHENPENLPVNDISSLQRPGPPIYDQASHKRRVMNAYWFTSLCVFQAQQESVRTHLGRFVTVLWLFAMLIFNSSYTASLASLLSAQERYPTIESFQALLKDERISVGYLQGSFMEEYGKRNLQGHKLKNFTSVNDYAQALRKGNDNPDGVGAVLDESPYLQILLESECDFTKSSTDDHPLPSYGGFGFAFRKGDPLIDQMSKMILAMAEDGTLQILQNGWKIGGDKRNRCDSSSEPSHLRLRSFGGLFKIVGSVYVICIIWHCFTKAIKTTEGSRSPLIEALPGSEHGSTIGRARDSSLSRRSNRVHDENQDAQIST